MHLRTRISLLRNRVEDLAVLGEALEYIQWRADMMHSLRTVRVSSPVILVSPNRKVVGRMNSAADAAEFLTYRPHWSEARDLDPETGEVML